MSGRPPAQSNTTALVDASTAVARLRREHEDAVGSLGDDELQRLVDGDLEDARALEIRAPEDLYRFVAIRFWPRGSLDSPLSRAVVLRVLNNLDLPAAVRLDFIEKHVRDRARRP